MNTTRKTQYDEGEEEAEEVNEETDSNRNAPKVTGRQKMREEESPQTEEGYETTIRKRTKTNLVRTEKHRAPTPPEETPPTKSATTEGLTHSVQDKEESRDTIENMNITEILTHTSARIMSSIGEKLMGSICLRTVSYTHLTLPTKRIV